MYQARSDEHSRSSDPDLFRHAAADPADLRRDRRQRAAPGAAGHGRPHAGKSGERPLQHHRRADTGLLPLPVRPAASLAAGIAAAQPAGAQPGRFSGVKHLHSNLEYRQPADQQFHQHVELPQPAGRRSPDHHAGNPPDAVHQRGAGARDHPAGDAGRAHPGAYPGGLQYQHHRRGPAADTAVDAGGRGLCAVRLGDHWQRPAGARLAADRIDRRRRFADRHRRRPQPPHRVRRPAGRAGHAHRGF